MYHTALFLLKHPFYVQIPILFGGQHSEDHSVLTRWTIIAQAEQNKYRSNWSKLWVQGTREDAGAQLRQIFQMILKVRNLLLYCYVYSKTIALFYMPVHLYLILNGFAHRCLIGHDKLFVSHFQIENWSKSFLFFELSSFIVYTFSFCKLS